MAFDARDLDLETQRSQMRFDAAAQLLPMLQRAGRMEREALESVAPKVALECGHEIRQHFAQIARERADSRRPAGVRSLAGQRVPVFLDGEAAGRGGSDDGLDI